MGLLIWISIGLFVLGSSDVEEINEEGNKRSSEWIMAYMFIIVFLWPLELGSRWKNKG